MKPTRENLLDLLHTSHSSGKVFVRLLGQFHVNYSTPKDVSVAIEEFLSRTQAHQALLDQCLLRIDGIPEPGQPREDEYEQENDGEKFAGSNVMNELARLHVNMLHQIELLTSTIDSAEATGFFESKLVCEGILEEKLLMMNRISTIISGEDLLNLQTTNVFISKISE